MAPNIRDPPTSNVNEPPTANVKEVYYKGFFYDVTVINYFLIVFTDFFVFSKYTQKIFYSLCRNGYVVTQGARLSSFTQKKEKMRPSQFKNFIIDPPKKLVLL